MEKARARFEGLNDWGIVFPLLSPNNLILSRRMKKLSLFLASLFLAFLLNGSSFVANAASWINVSESELAYYDIVGTGKTFSDAGSYCSGLSGRLPTLSEAQSIQPDSGVQSVAGSTWSWTSTVDGSNHNYFRYSSADVGNSLPDSTELNVLCVKPISIPTCTSWTYSDWSLCSGGSQSRTVVTSSPDGCINGVPITSRTCSVNGATIGIISEKDADDISTGLGSLVSSFESVIQNALPSAIQFSFLLIGISIVILLLNKGRNSIKKV